MNNSIKSFLFIPLTHTLLIVAATTILTIFATTQHKTYFLASFYALAFFYTVYKNKTSWLITLMCIFMTSFLITARISHQLSIYKSDQSFLKTPLTIKGIIEQVNHSTLTKDQTTIIIKSSHIHTRQSSLKNSKKISIFFPTTFAQKIKEGDIITIYDIQLEQPKSQSDYELYLIKEGFWATGRSTKHTQFTCQKQPPSFQQKFLCLLKKQLSKKSRSLFDPLFLGKKEKNKSSLDVQHKSIYWGIAHHMARSGVHLAILFGLIMLLLHYTQFAYIYRYAACVILLTTYALISQSSISFLRALCMILLYIFAKILKKIPSSLHTLTLTTLLTLFYNPMQLFFLDFQLSFGITYIIIWLFNIKKSKTIAFYKQLFIRF